MDQNNDCGKNLKELLNNFRKDYIRYIKYFKFASENTIQTYNRVILQFIDFFEKNCNKSYFSKKGCILDNIKEYCFFQNKSKNTLNLRIIVLRNFFKYIKENKKFFKDVSFENINCIKNKKQDRIPVFLNLKEIEYLLNAIKSDKNIFSIRDYAIVNLFIKTGLRVSELINLKVNDVFLEDKLIKVYRKGGKQQHLPLSKKMICILNKYLQWRKDYLLKRKENNIDYLFFTKNLNRFSRMSLRKTLLKYYKKAGINKEKYGLHIFRHTTAYLLFKENINIRIIQKFLGHSNIQTTMKYGEVFLSEHAEIIGQIMDKL